jgi:hypothetical protein
MSLNFYKISQIKKNKIELRENWYLNSLLWLEPHFNPIRFTKHQTSIRIGQSAVLQIVVS